MMLRVNNWELLIVSGLLILTYISRHRGNLPGAWIRSVDLALLVAVLGFALHAGRAGRRAIRIHVGIALLAVALSVIALIIDADPIQRAAGGGVTAYVIAASTFLTLRVVMRQRKPRHRPQTVRRLTRVLRRRGEISRQTSRSTTAPPAPDQPLGWPSRARCRQPAAHPTLVPLPPGRRLA